METFKSDISGQEFPAAEQVESQSIHPSLLMQIRRQHPDFKPGCKMAIQELNLFRQKYIAGFLAKDIEELTEMEKTVLNTIKEEHSIFSDNLQDKVDAEADATFGQRVADKVADFGGSWTFIISFGVFILIWIVANIWWLRNQGFDPYPFILLNLMLSCLAALQAPVIMMSQNRQEEKDRERAKNDYMINLKSELEIRLLHDKLDHLIINQQQQLLEIQQEQLRTMADILDRLDPERKNQSDVQPKAENDSLGK